MKKSFMVCGTVATLLLFTGFVHADLVGETVLVERHFQFLNTVIEGYSVTVQEGDADKLTDFGEFTVDVNSTEMIVDFLELENFGPASFNGLVISDWSSDLILLDVTVETNLMDPDWNPLFDIQFGEDFAAFNWSDVQFQSSTDFKAIFEFADPIPLPATMVLFVTGLCGFAAVRRLIRKH